MKFKEGVKIVTSDFWYDLTDGGYIRPEELLEDPEEGADIRGVVECLMRFREEAEKQGVLEEM